MKGVPLPHSYGACFPQISRGFVAGYEDEVMQVGRDMAPVLRAALWCAP